MVDLMAQRDAFGAALVDLGGRDDRICVLDADLGSSSKANLFQEACPERFFQVGIAEQNMAGIAAGLATMGFIPFINTFAAFASTRIIDQVRTSVAQPAYQVKIAGAYAGLLAGKTGKTHLSVIDLAIMRSMPNMTVLAPADAVEAGKAVLAAAAHPGPVFLRLTRDPSPLVFGEDYEFVVGRAVPVLEGRDVRLMTTGSMLPRAVEAAAELAEEDVDAAVLHLPTVKPLDEDAVAAAAERTGRVVTAEEHSVIGGLGGAVAETLAEMRPTPMRRVGVDDLWGESAPNDDLLAKYGVDAAHLAAAARELIAAYPRRT